MEVPLSEIPLYTRATSGVSSCVRRVSSSLSVTYGCPTSTPGPCLCTDPNPSLEAVTSIRSCLRAWSTTDMANGTQLWASYCSINGGVSARDETLVQDIPLYERVTSNVASCVLAQTADFRTTFGCNDWTRASCLCQAPERSSSIQNAIYDCLYSTAYREDASQLWGSWCSVNLQTLATRAVGEPPHTIVTTTSNPTESTTDPSSRASGTDQSSSNSNSGGGLRGGPIAGIVVAAVVVLIIIAGSIYYTVAVVLPRRHARKSTHPPSLTRSGELPPSPSLGIEPQTNGAPTELWDLDSRSEYPASVADSRNIPASLTWRSAVANAH